MPPIKDHSFDNVLKGVKEYQDEYPENLAFIGGIAVYCQAMDDNEARAFIEHTHDADFMIATQEFYALRNEEDVQKNSRLGKYQTERHSIEFDIYEQQISSLTVPVEEVLAASEMKHGVRVACLEHLLALKMAAFLDRQTSSKGEKDANDVARILYLASDRQIVAFRLAHITPEMQEALHRIAKGPVALNLAQGNAHVANRIRTKMQSGLEKVVAGLKSLPQRGFPNEIPPGKDGQGL